VTSPGHTYGQTTWDAAISSPINASDVAEGIRVGRERLDDGFFRARWARATPAERDDVAAMAVDGDGPSSTGEVAARLGKKPTSLGPIRANSIARGLVYPPVHGQIAFTIPGTAAFIRREGIAEQPHARTANRVAGLRDGSRMRPQARSRTDHRTVPWRVLHEHDVDTGCEQPPNRRCCSLVGGAACVDVERIIPMSRHLVLRPASLAAHLSVEPPPTASDTTVPASEG
jgi:hypothetical protein